MTDRMARLAAVADLLRDHALHDLRVAGQARADLQRKLAGLAPAPGGTDPDLADWANAVLHQRWADARRAEINLLLARQTADWIEARGWAARATGRAEALARLRKS
jgi:hypothetical protein